MAAKIIELKIVHYQLQLLLMKILIWPSLTVSWLNGERFDVAKHYNKIGDVYRYPFLSK